MTRLGRPTGPKPGFTRDDVVTAALKAGVGDFTLSLVAQRLGVATSALYRTISSRDDLLRACLTRISAESPFDSLSGGWQEVARDYAERMLLMLGRYPGLAGVLMTVPWAHQVFAPSIATILQALQAGGLDYHRAVAVLDFVADTVISGCAQQENMRRHHDVEGAQGGTPAPQPAGAQPAATLTGLELARRSYESDAQAAVLPVELVPTTAWLEQDWIRSKVEIIIAGVGALALGDGAPGDGSQGPRRA